MKLLSASVLLFLLVGSALAQSISGKGSIAGRVTHNGKGIKGVTVSLRLETSRSQSNDPQTTETNLEGEYKFEALVDGSYHLEIASANQYASESAAQNLNRRWQTVVIENGSTASGIDFSLALGAVITGMVKDAKGRPLIEARINLMEVDTKGNVIQSYVALANQSDRQTDDRGVYRIYGIPAGRYLVSARPRQAKGEQEDIFHPSVKDATQATVVELAAGAEQAGVDIIFPLLEKGYTLSGRVIDAESKQPVANATVHYVKYEVTTAGDQQYHKHLSADLVPTDVDGKFVFKGVVAGKYAVFANSFMELKYTEPVWLEMAQTDIAELELTLLRSATLRGRIRIEGAGEIVDLSKLQLSAFVFTPQIQRTNNAISAKIQPDGNYEINRLLAGKVHLSISDAGHQYTLLRLEKNGVAIDQAVSLQAGETLTDINIVLSAGKGTIKGQVMVEGKTAPSICLSILAERISASDGRTPWALAQTDAQGRFIFDRLLPGEYELITHPGYASLCGASTVPKFATIRQRVRITDKQEQRVTMIIKITDQ